jgi:hypothetical protein
VGLVAWGRPNWGTHTLAIYHINRREVDEDKGSRCPAVGQRPSMSQPQGRQAGPQPDNVSRGSLAAACPSRLSG